MRVSSVEPSRRDKKRAEIVSVAKELFFQEGYAGTSMAQIAARVGGSKATLYNHFTSKEELLLAVVKQVTDPATAQAMMGEAPADFRKWLMWLGRIALKTLTSHESLSMQRLAAAEALRFPEIGRIFYEEGIRPGHVQLAQRFKAAMDAGELRNTDPVDLVETFLDLCAGWPLRRVIWNLEPPPTDAQIDARVRDVVRAFMEGWGKR